MGGPGSLLLLPLLLLGVAESRSHSLQYFLTAVSEPGPGVPEFTVAGYVDGQRFVEYDGEAQQMRPRAPWMQETQPEVWERENHVHKVRQACFRGKVRSHRHLYNQSRGFHIFQYAYGCEIRADGSTGGFRRFGYDGGDFLIYDAARHRWEAPAQEAETTQRRWNGDPVALQYYRHFLEREAPGRAGHRQRRPRRPHHPLLPGPRLLPPGHRPELAATRGEQRAGDGERGGPAQRGRDLPRLGHGGDRPPGERPVPLPCGAREPGPAARRRVGAAVRVAAGPGGGGRDPGPGGGRRAGWPGLEEEAVRAQGGSVLAGAGQRAWIGQLHHRSNVAGRSLQTVKTRTDRGGSSPPAPPQRYLPVTPCVGPRSCAW